MEASLRLGEIVMLLAGLLMVFSLPLLARDSFLLWFGAQGLYFFGALMILIRFIVRGDA